MALGDIVAFDEAFQDVLNGVHDFANDTFRIALINNTTVPTRDTATPRLADFTEVSGTGYTAGGEALTITVDESSNVIRIRHTGGTITWSQNGAGPTDVYYGIIYNDSAAADQAIQFVDFTADNGVTPASLQTADITFTPEATASRLLTLQRQ